MRCDYMSFLTTKPVKADDQKDHYRQVQVSINSAMMKKHFRKVNVSAAEQTNWSLVTLVQTYEQHKKGRTITGFTFTFKYKNKPKAEK